MSDDHILPQSGKHYTSGVSSIRGRKRQVRHTRPSAASSAKTGSPSDRRNQTRHTRLVSAPAPAGEGIGARVVVAASDPALVAEDDPLLEIPGVVGGNVDLMPALRRAAPKPGPDHQRESLHRALLPRQSAGIQHQVPISEAGMPLRQLHPDVFQLQRFFDPQDALFGVSDVGQAIVVYPVPVIRPKICPKAERLPLQQGGPDLQEILPLPIPQAAAAGGQEQGRKQHGKQGGGTDQSHAEPPSPAPGSRSTLLKSYARSGACSPSFWPGIRKRRPEAARWGSGIPAPGFRPPAGRRRTSVPLPPRSRRRPSFG